MILMPLRGEKPECITEACIGAAIESGAQLITSHFLSDIAKHRCVIQERCYRTIVDPMVDTAVWVDGDSVFSKDILAALVGISRHTLGPVSGCYVSRQDPAASARICAHVLPSEPPVRLSGDPELPWECDSGITAWRAYTGMGMLAVPMAMMRELSDSSVPIVGDYPYRAVCWSGPYEQDGHYVWAGEDTTYCERLGSLDRHPALPALVPLSVGHVTASGAVRWPTEESCASYPDGSRRPPWGHREV